MPLATSRALQTRAGAWLVACSLAWPLSAAAQGPVDVNPRPNPEHRLQFLPFGLLYRSYIAGEKEPRIGAQWLRHPEVGWIWETVFGARVPAFRYGTDDPLAPEGLQLDVEGAAFTRVDVGTGTDVDSVDFRAGFLLTWRSGPMALKGGIAHISSHVSDEYLIRNPGHVHRDYVRDSFIGGIAYDLTPEVTAYGELAYAHGRQGGAEPFESQFGIQYSPRPVQGAWWGRPFGAVNVHLRQEFGFRPTYNVLGGVQWRSRESMRALRSGLQYFNGQSLQYSFFDEMEEWVGIGAWLDF